MVAELFSCRNGQPQQQPRGSIDFVIHSDNQIRFYVINTHTDTHTEYPQRLRAHTHNVKQCQNMNSIWNQITLHLSVLLLALFKSVVHILQAQLYFNYNTVGTQTTLPPCHPLYLYAIN